MFWEKGLEASSPVTTGGVAVTGCPVGLVMPRFIQDYPPCVPYYFFKDDCKDGLVEYLRDVFNILLINIDLIGLKERLRTPAFGRQGPEVQILSPRPTSILREDR